ncbi:hypothetical protein ACHAWF_004900 [Thalassiosira exigua]
MFLMRKADMTLNQSMALCRRRRPVVDPIPTFVDQLRAYEGECRSRGHLTATDEAEEGEKANGKQIGVERAGDEGSPNGKPDGAGKRGGNAAGNVGGKRKAAAGVPGEGGKRGRVAGPVGPPRGPPRGLAKSAAIGPAVGPRDVGGEREIGVGSVDAKARVSGPVGPPRIPAKSAAIGPAIGPAMGPSTKAQAGGKETADSENAKRPRGPTNRPSGKVIGPAKPPT